MGFFSKFIGGLCATLVLAGAVACAVPDTRQKLADAIATNYSPAYAEIKDDNAKQAEEIINLNGQVATCTANINTLITQRTTLLASVTAIDNKINSTTDLVELENLEVRKTAIIEQVDTLNAQITALNLEKSNLQSRVIDLEQQLKNRANCYLEEINYVLESDVLMLNDNEDYQNVETSTMLSFVTEFDNYLISESYISQNYVYFFPELGLNGWSASYTDNIYVFNDAFVKESLLGDEQHTLSTDKLNTTRLNIKFVDSNGVEFNLKDNTLVNDTYSIQTKVECEVYTNEELETLFPDFYNSEFCQVNRHVSYLKSICCVISFENFDSIN